MIGILNASQKRTNRAPLTEALISRHPSRDEKRKYMDLFVTSLYSVDGHFCIVKKGNRGSIYCY